MAENPAQKVADDRDRQAQEPAQTTDIAVVQQQIQAGEAGSSRQQNQHASRYFWQVAGASESFNPEPKSERSQERQRQQERDGLGFSL